MVPSHYLDKSGIEFWLVRWFSNCGGFLLKEYFYWFRPEEKLIVVSMEDIQKLMLKGARSFLECESCERYIASGSDKSGTVMIHQSCTMLSFWFSVPWIIVAGSLYGHMPSWSWLAGWSSHTSVVLHMSMNTMSGRFFSTHRQSTFGMFQGRRMSSVSRMMF